MPATTGARLGPYQLGPAVGTDNGVTYLVTELLEGRTLREEMSPDVGQDLQVRHEAGLKPTPYMPLHEQTTVVRTTSSSFFNFFDSQRVTTAPR